MVFSQEKPAIYLLRDKARAHADLESRKAPGVLSSGPDFYLNIPKRENCPIRVPIRALNSFCLRDTFVLLINQ